MKRKAMAVDPNWLHWPSDGSRDVNFDEFFGPSSEYVRNPVKLGSGAYGFVYRFDWIAYGQGQVHKIAVKFSQALDSEILVRQFGALDHNCGAPQLLDYLRNTAEPTKALLRPTEFHQYKFAVAMEYIDGERLFENLHKVYLAETPNLAAQLLAQVACIHEHGVAHIDIRSPNVMLLRETDSRGAIVHRLRLIDYGIACLFDASKIAAQDIPEEIKCPRRLADDLSGWIVKDENGWFPKFGTPASAFPSKATPNVEDLERIDDYMAGMVMLELITQRRPYELATRSAQRMTSKPENVAEFVLGGPVTLQALQAFVPILFGKARFAQEQDLWKRNTLGFAAIVDAIVGLTSASMSSREALGILQEAMNAQSLVNATQNFVPKSMQSRDSAANAMEPKLPPIGRKRPKSVRQPLSFDSIPETPQAKRAKFGGEVIPETATQEPQEASIASQAKEIVFDAQQDWPDSPFLITRAEDLPSEEA